jgi:hypothetical protein
MHPNRLRHFFSPLSKQFTVIVTSDTRKHFLLQISILSMHVCKATIQDYKSVEFGILIFFPDFWEWFFHKLARFFEQNFNISLFYQNLIELIFFKNSKWNPLKKVWTNQRNRFLSTCWPWIPVDYRQKSWNFRWPLCSPEITKSGNFYLRASILSIAQASITITSSATRSSQSSDFQMASSNPEALK